jgi:predicted O-methyltransferase YrrM
MYSPLQLAIKYCKYYFKASNGKGHGIHSPFLYTFITEVLNDNRQFYAYDKIETLRRQLLNTDKELVIEDFGAGSRKGLTKNRKVAEIANSSLKPKKFAQLLFRMINYYQPQIILELGTSLGITTSYLAAAKLDAEVITMEGAASIASIAKENFNQLNLNNINVVEGNFDETLSNTLAEIKQIDFAFLDGNHRYQPTIDYFNQVLEKSNENTIMVIDDIHWSKEMDQAWDYIKQHPQVTLSIDLFFIGIILFRKEFKIKQDFVIRF